MCYNVNVTDMYMKHIQEFCVLLLNFPKFEVVSVFEVKTILLLDVHIRFLEDHLLLYFSSYYNEYTYKTFYKRKLQNSLHSF